MFVVIQLFSQPPNTCRPSPPKQLYHRITPISSFICLMAAFLNDGAPVSSTRQEKWASVPARLLWLHSFRACSSHLGSAQFTFRKVLTVSPTVSARSRVTEGPAHASQDAELSEPLWRPQFLGGGGPASAGGIGISPGFLTKNRTLWKLNMSLAHRARDLMGLGKNRWGLWKPNHENKGFHCVYMLTSYLGVRCVNVKDTAWFS